MYAHRYLYLVCAEMAVSVLMNPVAPTYLGANAAATLADDFVKQLVSLAFFYMAL